MDKEKNPKLHPTDDHIVVEPVVQESKTASGLYIPDTSSKERPQKGKVVAVANNKVVKSVVGVQPCFDSSTSGNRVEASSLGLGKKRGG